MSDAETTVMTGLVKHDTGSGYRMTLQGEPHANALVEAAVASYPRAELDPEAWVEKPVTLLVHSAGAFGAPSISTWEGRIHRSYNRPGEFAFLPKGARTKGYVLPTDRILDIVAGFHPAFLVERVSKVRDSLPTLVPLTQERLNLLPEEAADDPTMCTLAVMGTWRSPDGDRSAGAIWLLHSYMHDDDIVEGVLFVDPAVGCSEHGSIYGRDLLGFGGEVVGFEPIRFGTALEWTDQPLAFIHDRLRHEVPFELVAR